ncbi:hypothetical protein GCM10028784_14410 [Myceligenerans cantabricum]
MYDAGPPARTSTVAVGSWVVAGTLVLVAVVSMLWLFSRDGVEPSAGATSTASPEAVARTSGAAEVSATPSSEPSPVPSPTPPPPPPDPPVVALQGVGSGRCVDVPEALLNDGATLQIYDCNGSVAQRWTVSATGELRVGGTKCLDDPSGGASGVGVAINECHGGANQRWSAGTDGTVRNIETGLCLDVEGAGTENGSPLNVYECHAGANQQWSIG